MVVLYINGNYYSGVNFMMNIIEILKAIYHVIVDTFVGIFQIVDNIPRFINYVKTFIGFIFPPEIITFLFLAITISVVLFIIDRKG